MIFKVSNRKLISVWDGYGISTDEGYADDVYRVENIYRISIG